MAMIGLGDVLIGLIECGDGAVGGVVFVRWSVCVQDGWKGFDGFECGCETEPR
jgi:hypothetical protein